MIDLNSAMTPMSISVSLDLEDRVRAAAKECGVNISSFARQAFEAYLTALEGPRYKLLSDNDGHHYLVPAEKEEEFNEWVDSFDDEESTARPDGYEKLGAESLGCSPT